jgi:hypothetical protein
MKTSFTSGFGVEVIGSKFARHSAVRSRAWLGLIGYCGITPIVFSQVSTNVGQ